MVEVRRVNPADFVSGSVAGPAAAVDRIRAACAETDHLDPVDEATSLRLRNHGLAGSALWLVSDSGFALLHEPTGTLDVAVAPSARRCHFGNLLVRTALEAAGGTVLAWSHGDHPGAAALAGRHGFDRARELWVLRRPTVDLLPEGDPGVHIRTFRSGDEAELLRVNAAAFAHHPEQGAMTAADLAERMAEPWFEPEGLFLAVDGDVVLGFHWTKVHPSGDGEVYVIGVDPAAHGRGLGRSLTVAGLAHLAARGVPEVLLYVDATNAAGLALYKGLGFRHAETHVQYRRSG